jgi:hypothetical protein
LIANLSFWSVYNDRFKKIDDEYRPFILKHFGLDIKNINFNILNENQYQISRPFIKTRYNADNNILLIKDIVSLCLIFNGKFNLLISLIFF